MENFEDRQAEEGPDEASSGSAKKVKLCDHKKLKGNCKVCSPHIFCPHGRKKKCCAECDGCPHGLVKYRCKVCAVSGIAKGAQLLMDIGTTTKKAPTKKAPPIAKQAPTKKKWVETSKICKCGKREIQCVTCKGSSICRHGRLKYRCKECWGSQICFHGKNKAYCKDCDGSQICECGKFKKSCAKCCQKCAHGRMPRSCAECKSAKESAELSGEHSRRSLKCDHGKMRRLCKECDGSGLCEHDKDKARCIRCKNARRGLDSV